MTFLFNPHLPVYICVCMRVYICFVCFVKLKDIISDTVVVNLSQFQPFLTLPYKLHIQGSKSPY